MHGVIKNLSMALSDKRYVIEEQFHDTKAIEGVNDFYKFGALAIADEYLWLCMGDLRGKRVLEIGCGDGVSSVRFAESGAHVSCIDISGEMVELTKKLAEEQGLSDRIEARKMTGEQLNFPDQQFDIVYGHSVLHHLDLDLTRQHLARVLKPGGFGIFLEPLDYNPLLNFFRLLTPQRRTPTEKPLTFTQIKFLARAFSRWEHKEFYLFSLIAFFWYYVLRNKKLFHATLKFLSPIDEFLFRLVPPLSNLAWVTIVKFHK